MATRFYLPSSGTPPFSSLAIHSYWDLPAGGAPQFARLPMFTTRQNTALASSNSTWTTTSTRDWCWWQFQSEALTADFTIPAYTTCTLVMGLCSEAAATADSYLEFTLRVIDSGGSQRSVVTSTSALGTEFPTTAASRYTTDIPLSSVAMFTGDILVLEVGLYGQTPSLSNCVMRIGDPTGTTEFTATNGDTNDYVPWFEINADIPLTAAVDVELDGSTTQTKQTVSGTATLTDVDVRLLQRSYSQAKQTVSGTLTLPDVFLHEGPSQTKQTVSGAATFTDVDVRLLQRNYEQTKQTVTGGLSVDYMLLYGSATQRAHHNSGILLLELTTDVAAPVPAGTLYALTVDGTEYPLVSAVVERHSRYERASATIPAALIQGILDASPVTLEITITRVLADGTGTTDTTLFTGTMDLTATTSGDQTGTLFADGSASYPSRVNRQLQGSPSYVRDSAESTAVRGQIDPSLVPGDVLRFSGVREVPVTKAVFNLTTDFQFMEAISGY